MARDATMIRALTPEVYGLVLRGHVCVAAVSIAMSDAEQSQRPRRLNENFLEAIVDAIPDMIWVKDADDLRFVLLNKGAEELLGIARGQLLGKSDYDLFPAEQADAFVAKDREVLATGGTAEAEEEILSATKGVRILHSKRFVIAEGGKPRYILGISYDITELVREREELRRQLEDAQKTEAIERSRSSSLHQNALTTTFYGSETILVVVEDAVVREFATFVLLSYGYNVFAASEIRAGTTLAAAHRGSIHLLISDVNPGATGLGLPAQLTRAHPNLRFVYVFGHKDDDVVHGTLGPGVGLIRKLFSPSSLARTVRDTLDWAAE